MRQHRQEGLTVPQFRALIFVSNHKEASLSSMADHVGLSLPAASRMVDLLVRRELVRRRQHPHDRRCIRLALTPRGRLAYRAALRETHAALTRCFRPVPDSELKVLRKALVLLSRTFTRTDAAMRNRV
jgi:DNA-binding MarR family transcriptional regulator